MYTLSKLPFIFDLLRSVFFLVLVRHLRRHIRHSNQYFTMFPNSSKFVKKHCATHSQLSSWCFEMRWDTVSHVGYINLMWVTWDALVVSCADPFTKGIPLSVSCRPWVYCHVSMDFERYKLIYRFLLVGTNEQSLKKT